MRLSCLSSGWLICLVGRTEQSICHALQTACWRRRRWLSELPAGCAGICRRVRQCEWPLSTKGTERHRSGSVLLAVQEELRPARKRPGGRLRPAAHVLPLLTADPRGPTRLRPRRSLNWPGAGRLAPQAVTALWSRTASGDSRRQSSTAMPSASRGSLPRWAFRPGRRSRSNSGRDASICSRCGAPSWLAWCPRCLHQRRPIPLTSWLAGAATALMRQDRGCSGHHQRRAARARRTLADRTSRALAPGTSTRAWTCPGRAGQERSG